MFGIKCSALLLRTGGVIKRPPHLYCSAVSRRITASHITNEQVVRLHGYSTTNTILQHNFSGNNNNNNNSNNNRNLLFRTHGVHTCQCRWYQTSTNKYKRVQTSFLSSCQWYNSNKDTEKRILGRYYSDDARKDTLPQKRTLEPPIDDGRKARYYFLRFKFLLKTFGFGFKDLASDGKIAWTTWTKWKKHGRNYKMMTREELLHMHQTIGDWKKTLPTMIVFMFPFIGYFIPVVAFLFPKQMLSQHFWTAKQKRRFMQDEHTQRRQHYAPLLEQVAKCAELNQLCENMGRGCHPSNVELLRLKHVFTNEMLSLHQLPRHHLVTLCNCWSMKTGMIIPRMLLAKALQRKITRIHIDDLMVLKEGTETLTQASIAQAVHVRGLDSSGTSLESQQMWMEDWIHLSTQSNNEDNASFLAHSAIFKVINIGKQVEEVEK